MAPLAPPGYAYAVVKLLPNTMQHVLGNCFQCDSDSLFELVYICRKRGDINHPTNAHCTVLFEFGRAYSNTQNGFSLLVNTIEHTGLTAVRIIYQLKISAPEKVNISNIKHKILACSYTCCVNLKLFKQEVPKLLDCKMMSNFLKHPLYQLLSRTIFCRFWSIRKLRNFVRTST